MFTEVAEASLSKISLSDICFSKEAFFINHKHTDERVEEKIIAFFEGIVMNNLAPDISDLCRHGRLTFGGEGKRIFHHLKMYFIASLCAPKVLMDRQMDRQTEK